MSRNDVLLVMGQDLKLFKIRRLSYESRAEFQGRALCLIEDRLGKTAGTRWVEWDDYLSGLGTAYEHTGNPYQDRRKRVSGSYSESEARALLSGKFP